MNGIIIDGKVYEAVNKGLYCCSDCDLFHECNAKWMQSMKLLCEPIENKERVILRYSQPLTDKLNKNDNLSTMA